jgi:hypothetical protein
MSDTTLYDTDYVAWTEAQAEALRARGRGANAIDYELLAEEIEDMGRSETQACESLVEQILLHFGKIVYLTQPETVRHWGVEINAFRRTLRAKMTPSIAARLAREWPRGWVNARDALEDLAYLQERQVELPETCPWTFDDVLGRGSKWLPSAPDAP